MVACLNRVGPSVIASWPKLAERGNSMEDDLQSKNNMVGDQLQVLIEQVHGESRPFILIMPPMEDMTEAQLVTNMADIRYLQRTLRNLDQSLGKVHKLKNVERTTQ